MSDNYESGFIPAKDSRKADREGYEEQANPKRKSPSHLDSNYNYFLVMAYGPRGVKRIKVIKTRKRALASAKRWADTFHWAVYVRQVKFNRRAENVRLGLEDLSKHVEYIGNLPRHYGSVTTSLMPQDNDPRIKNLEKARAARRENMLKKEESLQQGFRPEVGQYAIDEQPEGDEDN